MSDVPVSRPFPVSFCHEVSDLLQGRVIVYKDVERWGWTGPALADVGDDRDGLHRAG